MPPTPTPPTRRRIVTAPSAPLTPPPTAPALVAAAVNASAEALATIRAVVAAGPAPAVRVGAEVDGWCSPCKGERRHRVVALDAHGRAARVECRSCLAQHRHRNAKVVAACATLRNADKAAAKAERAAAKAASTEAAKAARVARLAEARAEREGARKADKAARAEARKAERETKRADKAAAAKVEKDARKAAREAKRAARAKRSGRRPEIRRLLVSRRDEATGRMVTESVLTSIPFRKVKGPDERAPAQPVSAMIAEPLHLDDNAAAEWLAFGLAEPERALDAEIRREANAETCRAIGTVERRPRRPPSGASAPKIAQRCRNDAFGAGQAWLARRAREAY